MVESSIKASTLSFPSPCPQVGLWWGVPSLGTLHTQHLRLGQVYRRQSNSGPEPAAINEKFPNELVVLQSTVLVPPGGLEDRVMRKGCGCASRKGAAGCFFFPG